MLVRSAITEREKCDRKIAESRGDAPLFEDERRVFGGGIHVDDPLEDVYQAALRIVFSSTWKPEPNLGRIYRGQRRSCWTVVPTLFRKTQTEQTIEHELDQVRRLVRSFQAIKSLPDEQGVAVVQHYSPELKAATWLLDFTWDPLISLYFASAEGKDKDTGVVSYIGRGEWERFSAGGHNRLGEIRAIKVPDVPRISAQRAVFLDTSHPDLFEQFVPHSIWFRQKKGLVFEDPSASPPITKAALLPDKDVILDAINSFRKLQPPEDTTPLNVAPGNNAAEPLTAEDYMEIAESWCEANGWAFDRLCMRTLKSVCKFHARLQLIRDEIDVEQRSLHRLEDAVQEIHRCGPYCTLNEVLQHTLSRTPKESPEHARLQQVVREIEAIQ